MFVSAKRLVAGDSVLFIWCDDAMPFFCCKFLQVIMQINGSCFDFFVTLGYSASFRNESNQLLIGIRRANRPQTVMPSSVLSSDSMHIGLLAAAAHAAATNSRFTIFYNPR